ncbi:MAG: GNAT family N-acetyltransferase [Clostridia bacterium]|nr:GNAT family N-acetyltransferase [Clostridia bacterium]
METFRRATPEDLTDIMRVIHEAQAFMRTLDIDQWQDGYPEPETLLGDIEIGQLYVFADGKRVHAVAALSLLPEPVYGDIEGAWITGEGAKYLTVHRMAVDNASRGGGLAGRMLAEARRVAEVNDCASIRVDTHTGNLAMRRFLEKNGFAHCGVVYYYVKKGDPARVAYEKVL